MAVSFGVVLIVNDEPVPLTPKQATGAAGNLKANGMELELARPVFLGTPGGAANGLQQLVTKFDKKAKVPTADDLPDELKGIATKLQNVQLTVESFYLKIPGSVGKANKETMKYNFGMSAMFADGEELTVDPLPVGLKGLFLRVSNDDPVKGKT